jgi:hypothetical protein
MKYKEEAKEILACVKAMQWLREQYSPPSVTMDITQVLIRYMQEIANKLNREGKL